MRRMGNLRFGLLGIAVVMLLAGSLPVSAQIPDEFTNLQMLPKDIDKRELVSIMRNWAGALGVRCQYCHVGDDPNSLEGYDFASDAKETKKVSRAMMKMTGEINGTLLPATGREMLVRVTCVTCHRGLEKPEALDDLLMSVIDIEGVPAAMERYRKLRDEYYGTGSYDFSPLTLSSVAESLAQQHDDVDGAISLMKLSVELDPDEANSYLVLGQLQMQKGDKDAAVASMERALKLDPDNRWAKRMLERAKSAE